MNRSFALAEYHNRYSDQKYMRIASHEVVAQLMRQRNGQRGNARDVEVELRAVLHPSVDRSRIRRFADRVHVPAEQRREIAHLRRSMAVI